MDMVDVGSELRDKIKLMGFTWQITAKSRGQGMS